MNIFGFALATIKDFFLNETAIGSFAIQNWMFIAFAIVVVLVVLVVISSVKNSKHKEESEVKSEETGVADNNSEEAQVENAVKDAAEENNEEVQTEDGAEEGTQENTEDVVEEAVSENVEETATEEAPAQESVAANNNSEETQTEETAEGAPAEVAIEEAATENNEEVTEEAAQETAEEAQPEEVTEEATPENNEEAQPEDGAEEAAQETAEETQPEEVAEEAAAENNEEAQPEDVAEEATQETAEEEAAATEDEEEKPTKKTKKPATKEANKEDDMKAKPAPAKKETKAKTAETKPAAKKAATKKEEPAKVTVGKYEICNSSIGGFRYHLLANNGQLLYESKDYKTYSACEDAISKFINSVENGTFTVRADKFGNYKFHLKSATSNNIIYIGESYTAKKAALNSVESVKHFASVSPIVDATEAGFEVTTTAYEIPQEIKTAVKNKQGAVGKWAIEKVDEEDSSYVFLLFANNGQLLYESREFSSLANCRKGIETFVSTVEEGYFIIDDDKFGRYKFFLRSNKAGSLAEYVGPFYTDKSSCCSSANSVYKFALLTPVEL